MFLKLFISGGIFDLDPKYTDEDVRFALSAQRAGRVVSFDLRHGGVVRSRLTRRTGWSVATYTE